jgi:dTDP-4-amino-4,6-dideoxy-D-galactose acyltransferase
VSPCEFLEWDSEFFGIRIGRVSGRSPAAAELERAKAWCREEQIDCLYLLADSDRPETLVAAQASGFQLVDVRVTLERPLAGLAAAVTPVVRLCRDSDTLELRELARASHRDSRFYADPRFPRDLCDRLYETWIDRSIHGWADCVLVAEADSAPAGYLSCHLSAAAGSIGLLAVGAEHRGRGFGFQLVHAALQYFRDQGMEKATVVTQGRNITSQRLYQRCGFFTGAMQFWYHWWSGTKPR